MEIAAPHPRMRSVQSRANARVKELRAAFARGGPAGIGSIAIEGLHLLEEALRSRIHIDTVFLRAPGERLLERITLPPGIDILELPPDIFASAVPTEEPQGIAALAQPPHFTQTQFFASPAPLLLVLAGLQDPGNLGTLMRSAEAFGASGILALPGTVSPWNPKALRASSGSAFRLPFVTMTEDAAFAALATHAIPVLATVARDGQPAPSADLSGPLALLIGNEGAGLPPHLLARASALITIPCPGLVESLNAAIAGSLLLYESSRQRAECSRQRAASPHAESPR